MSAREQEYLDKVAKRPQDTLARYVLAKDYFDEGADEKAVAQFHEILALKPDWMKVWIHLGQSLLRLGRGREGREALEKALALAHSQHHEGPAGEIQDLLAGIPPA
jgi:Flp pilus assembly protein TadD